MVLQAPQLTYFAIILLSLGIAIKEHGTPKEGNNNVFTALISTLIQMAIMYWGGFFG